MKNIRQKTGYLHGFVAAGSAPTATGLVVRSPPSQERTWPRRSIPDNASRTRAPFAKLSIENTLSVPG
ncbi:hypothetical protein Xmar_04910 [Xanthomonas axonopodis pv. martyniicola]|uniref:hypothetical protein n=1 Tax=Xanthomonas axonopodis TaxID=53413 RepID=UPI000998A346|nr:hypothetical protein [Xanthomonas axonopodis]OOW70581.1 hypothetical protein Xmar_04910 [Xanthomonas axonopodis pv. martyniicola]OOW97297.1 hypothetical protein Xvtr_03690 [Xanthomonas campestris pv. vitiscarnosae]